MHTITTPQLRPYQVDVINALYREIRAENKRVLLVAPTGSGKTIISSQIVQHAVDRNRRVLFLVHLDVLVGQTYDKLCKFGLHGQCGFIKAGWDENPRAPIQIASLQTMARRRWWQTEKFDLIFFDEAHQTAFAQISQKIFQIFDQSTIVGLTATPYRLSKRQGLGDHFQAIVATPCTADLQKMGLLAPIKYWGLPQADLSKVKTIAGDFDSEGLKNACDRPELVQRTVEEWQRLTPGKRTIAFCVSVEHAQNLASAFREVGVTAATVTGETPIKERDRMYSDLREGRLQVLTSVNVVSIGFDEPSVEVGLLCRPTKSLALHHQQIGRIMRISPGKIEGFVLDQAGNCLRLGFPEEVTKYELTTGTPSDLGVAPKKECPECRAIVYAFVKICPHCGFEFPSSADVLSDKLVELLPGQKLDDQKLKTAFQRLRRQGYSKGYDPGWAFYRFSEKYGRKPDQKWYKGSIFPDPTEIDLECYYLALKAIARRKDKSQEWVSRAWTEEFGYQHLDQLRLLTAQHLD